MMDLGGFQIPFTVKYDDSGISLAIGAMSRLQKSVSGVSTAKEELRRSTEKLAQIQAILAKNVEMGSDSYTQHALAVRDVAAAQSALQTAIQASIAAQKRASQEAIDAIGREALARAKLNSMWTGLGPQNEARIAAENAAAKEAEIKKQKEAGLLAIGKAAAQQSLAAKVKSLSDELAATDRGNAAILSAERKLTIDLEREKAKRLADIKARVLAPPVTPPPTADERQAALFASLSAQARGLGATVSDPNAVARNAAAYAKLAEEARKAGFSIEKLTTTVDKDKKSQQGKHSVNLQLSQSFHALSSTVGILNSVLGSVASAFGGINLGEFIKESTLLAARVENLGTVLRNVGSLAGYTAGGINQISNQVQALNITTRQAREGLAFLAQGEIDLAQAGQMVRTAQDAAVIAGINSSDAFERLTIAVQRTNSWMLRNLGIMVNLNNIYRDFAISNGRMTNTLSTYEKQQLLINEVLRKGAAFAGTYEAALGDVFKQWTSMQRIAEEAQRSFGEQFIPIFEDLVSATTAWLESFQAAPDEVKATTAAVAAGAVAFMAAATAIGILSGALVLLGGTMAIVTGGLTLLIGGVLALVAATYVYDKAMAGNLRRNIKNAAEDAGAAEARITAVTNAIEKLRIVEARIKAGGDLAEHLEKARDIALEVAPALGAVGLNATKAMKDQAAAAAMTLKLLTDPGRMIALLTSAVPESAVDGRQRIAEYRREVEGLEKELIRLKAISDVSAKLQFGVPAGSLDNLRKTMAEYKRLRDSGEFGNLLPKEMEGKGQREYTAVFENTKNAINKVESLIAYKNASILERERSTNAAIAKDYEKMLHEIETAHNLALRIEHQNNDTRFNIWKDTHLDIFQDYEKMIDNMSNKIPDLSKLKAANEASLAVRVASQTDEADLKAGELRDKIATIKSEVGWEQNAENKKAVEDLERRIQVIARALQVNIVAARESFADELSKAEENLDFVAKVYTLAAGVLEDRLKKEDKLRELQKYVNDRVEAGQDEKLAKKEASILKEKELDKIASENTARKIEEDKKQLAFIEAQISVTPAEKDAKVRALEAVQLKIDALNKVEEERKKSHLEEMREIEREYAADVKDTREKLADDLKKIEEKLVDEETKLRKHLADMAERDTEHRLKLKEKEADAAIKVIDEEIKGLKKLEDAIDKNFKNAKKNIEIMREFGALVAKGIHPNAARAMLVEKHDIMPVGMQRMKAALEQRGEQLRIAKQIQEEKKAAAAEERRLASELKLADAVTEGGKKTKELELEITKLKDEIAKAREKAEKAKALEKDAFKMKGDRDLGADILAADEEGTKAVAKAIEDSAKRAAEKKAKVAAKKFEDAGRPAFAGSLADRKREMMTADVTSSRDRVGIIAPWKPGDALLPSGVMPRMIESRMGDTLKRVADESASAAKAGSMKDAETVAATSTILEGFRLAKDKALETAGKLSEQMSKFKEEVASFSREFTSKNL